MANELEQRIRGLLSTWDPVSPFRVSLKLVLDDVKRLEKPEPLRFSYETSRCGLPPTNINGRCRKYMEPKSIYAVRHQAGDSSIDVGPSSIGSKMKLAMGEGKHESSE